MSYTAAPSSTGADNYTVFNSEVAVKLSLDRDRLVAERRGQRLAIVASPVLLDNQHPISITQYKVRRIREAVSLTSVFAFVATAAYRLARRAR